MNLRQLALRGTLWSGVEAVAEQGTRFILFLVLARLLAPEDFGIVALASAIVMVLELVVKQDLATSIVQRDEIESEHLDSAFWASLGAGIVGFGVVVAGAGLLADALDQPTLAPTLRAIAPLLLLAPLSLVQQGWLRRELQFRALALRLLAGQVVGGGLAIWLAYRGAGAMSLVVQALAQEAVGVLVLWRVTEWRPRLRFELTRYRELLETGVRFLGLQLLQQVRRRADDFLIGAFLGPGPLGFYVLGRRFCQSLQRLIAGSINQVTWSAFARLQREPGRLRDAIQRTASMLSLLLFPALAGLVLVIPEIIAGIVGARWAPAIPVVRALAVLVAVQTVLYPALAALSATGGVQLRLRLEVLQATLCVVALALAAPWGIEAAAWAYAGTVALLGPYLLVRALSRLPVEPARYLAAQVPPLLATAVMAAGLVLLRSALPAGLHPLATLGALIGAGVILYGAFVALAFPRIAAEAWAAGRDAFRPATRLPEPVV
jgi:PST family polysaccharide transporter